MAGVPPVPVDELGPVLGGGVVQQLVAGHDSVKLSAHVAAGRGRHGQAGGHCGQAGGGEDIAGSVCGSDCCWAGQPEPAVGQLVPSPGESSYTVQTGTLQVGKCRNNNIVLAPQRVGWGRNHFSSTQIAYF